MAGVTASIITKPVVLIQVIAVQHLVLIVQQIIAQTIQQVVTQLVLMVHVVVIVIPVRIQIHLMQQIVKLLVMMVVDQKLAVTVNMIGQITALSAVIQPGMHLVLIALP
jgi:hypothetical protein